MTNIKGPELVKIDDLRARHLQERVIVEGKIIQASDVRPQLIRATRKSREFLDVQRIIIASGKEFYDPDMEMKVPVSRLNAFLKGELCDPKYKIFDKLGKKVRLTGMLVEMPVLLENGKVSERYDIALDVEKIEFI